MRAIRGIQAGAAVALMALVACGEPRDPQLMNIRSQTRSPDEFAVLPVKPLEMPEDIAALPEPTPGAQNRTDPTPEADAVAALGGNVGRARQGDPGLLAHAGRFGTSGDIRQQLAAEDLAYRRANDGRLLERAFNVNVYFRAYEPMTLDRYAELERWRRAGVRTVSAPPETAN